MARGDRLKKLQAQMIGVNRKTLQAVRIRTKLAIKKNKAVLQYGSSMGTAPVIALKRVLKNEKKFIKILDYGLEEGIKIGKEYRKEIKKMGASREFIRHVNFSLWVLKYYLRKMKKIKRRVKHEEKFLESGSEEDFSAFAKAWKREFKIDKKVAKRLNPAKISKIRSFANKISTAVAGIGIGTGTLGAAGGIMAGLFAIYANVQAGSYGSFSAKDILTVTIASAIFGSLVGLCMGIVAAEQELVDAQQKATVRLKAI